MGQATFGPLKTGGLSGFGGYVLQKSGVCCQIRAPKGSNSLVFCRIALSSMQQTVSASRHYEAHTSGLLDMRPKVHVEPDLRLKPEQV